MKYDFDLICIGLGPAGMAVSAMGSEMGLKVCGIEKNKIGGECMNVGCIPSKSLLRIAKYRHSFIKLQEMGLAEGSIAGVKSPFEKINEYLDYIAEEKNMKMFDKVTLILGEGEASFTDPYTVKVGERNITARRIFIATGAEPMIPPIKGISDVDILTNQNIFNLSDFPESMTIIGGGAIGCEMAQAFNRLGTKCIIVQMDDFLIPNGEKAIGDYLEEIFKKEDIEVYNSRKITEIKKEYGSTKLLTEDGLSLSSEKLLVAAGKRFDFSSLKLENAGVEYGKAGIKVDDKYRTTRRHIYAVGDCNGENLLTHAAMHQGMFAIMNAVSPGRVFRYRKYVIPWTVFTEPQVSMVGMKEEELKEKGIKYQVYTAKYENYGAAIAENVREGYVKVLANGWGRVFGAIIVGDGSGEMINEWALIIQKKIRLFSILFLAHSFPTMGFLTKRIAEQWMMAKMKSNVMKNLLRFCYRKL
ncbi:MAG: NAD(P)/FAD-dependent oxidoreductase [Atribacterota bacterium]|jgi:pyruvate/2-oxoglutarate dehydrogenase complex dihydrolipoamide dehydrogenase (E3) component|nr:NAD(P)/FAD-dependent oxidoreductase [Atribacterota bacterium]MDD5637959.1 NAD(P)/FAD-dependent oxidoreductase [Atribacterota bacterium]